MEPHRTTIFLCNMHTIVNTTFKEGRDVAYVHARQSDGVVKCQ